MIQKLLLQELYTDRGKSMMEIANHLGCSANAVDYWMRKHKIPKRTISDAVYIKNNPDGDPFVIPTIKTLDQAELYGLGIGLYWGEGTKANKWAVRLGNTDPELLKAFKRFLVELFEIDPIDLRYGLQIFTDINQEGALNYWYSQLEATPEQFYKVHVTISGSLGTYRHKSQYGVVTLYYHNKKLRDILVGMLPR
jgi:hypothetical protein